MLTLYFFLDCLWKRLASGNEVYLHSHPSRKDRLHHPLPFGNQCVHLVQSLLPFPLLLQLSSLSLIDKLAVPRASRRLESLLGASPFGTYDVCNVAWSQALLGLFFLYHKDCSKPFKEIVFAALTMSQRELTRMSACLVTMDHLKNPFLVASHKANLIVKSIDDGVKSATPPS